MCVHMSVCMDEYFQRVCACYLCSLIQSQGRTCILSSSSVQLCNYWQREREEEGEEKERGQVPHKARLIYLPLFFPEAATRIDLCSPFLSYRNIQRVTGSL